ncbi:MAG: HIT domain-containing protein [Candidatus Shapirobacteria bacterium]
MESDCIFCKIVSGAIPCYKVYEDADFLGFLDIKPLNPGNSLIIPKTHHRWVTDVPEFGRYWEVAKIVALATQPQVKADYVSFLTLGMEVPHAHIRVIPRFFNDAHTHGIDTNTLVNLSPQELSNLARTIYQSIKP